MRFSRFSSLFLLLAVRATLPGLKYFFNARGGNTVGKSPLVSTRIRVLLDTSEESLGGIRITKFEVT